MARVSIHKIAQRFLDSGISIIPIAIDGSKAPDGRYIRSWSPYQKRLPTEDEIERWFSADDAGIAIIGGAVSGNLERIDFDEPGRYDAFRELAEQCGYTELVDSLPLVLTPREGGGHHLYYRCAEPVEGNQALAQGVSENGKPHAIIETRGEGGYTISPGSPGVCHPTGNTYKRLRGNLFTPPVINVEDRQALLEMCRSFNEYFPAPTGGAKITAEAKNGRPGDDYNQRGEWRGLLTKAGWKHCWTCGEVEYWRRPDKKRGISATFNYSGSGVFYVFTSNGHPFEPAHSYTPFGIYGLMEHGGDFAAAATALGNTGFGKPIGSAKTKDRSKHKRNSGDDQADELEALLRLQWFEGLGERNTEWLLPGLIARRGVTILAGEPGAGKTTLAGELAYHIATGHDHWGESVMAGRVLWLGYDDAPERIRSEVIEVLGDIPEKTICTILDPPALGEVSLPLYIKFIAENEISLVVVDTVLDWFMLEDFDKTGPVREAMDSLRRFVELTGAAVLGICHVNKDITRQGVGRIANSTQLTAKCDVAAVLLNDYADDNMCQLRIVKNRVGPSGWKTNLRKIEGRFEPAGERRPMTTTERIYDVISETGGIKRTEVVERFSGVVSERAITRAVKRLINDGRVEGRYIAGDAGMITYFPVSLARAHAQGYTQGVQIDYIDYMKKIPHLANLDDKEPLPPRAHACARGGVDDTGWEDVE